MDVAKEHDLVTVNELALLTRYNPQTIYRKLKKGQLHGVVRFGRGIRFVRRIAVPYLRRQSDA